MDYSRIYAEFINDRRRREADATSMYHEMHHIIPRGLGGGEDGNVIALTAEDHFFAHLLLARMHGGIMWSALFLMTGDRWGGRKGIGLRAAYGLARREWAKYAATLPGLSGADNGMHDPTEYQWINIDTGEERTATKSNMWALYGGTRGHWTSATTGARKTYKGWYVGITPALRSNKGKTLSFENRDGRTFIGVQKEFCDAMGLSYATGSRIVRRGAVSVCGWKIAGNARSDHFAMKTRKNTGRSYRIAKGTVEFIGKAPQCAETIGVTVQQFHAGSHCVAKSRTRTYKGWEIERAEG